MMLIDTKHRKGKDDHFAAQSIDWVQLDKGQVYLQLGVGGCTFGTICNVDLTILELCAKGKVAILDAKYM